MNMDCFTVFLCGMLVLALIVFIALYFIDAGYGMFRSSRWGFSVNNKLAWILMEVPVPVLLLLFLAFAERKDDLLVPCLFLLLLEIHYIHRAFIFPLLMRGNGKMPVGILSMGITFNLINAFLQGYWLFYLAPPYLYTNEWIQTPQFIIGTCLFFTGFIINIDSDRRIRSLRTEGDTKHYLPHGGMFRYVTSANYFGELVEWTGFAIATWAMPGMVFAIWTFANLVPRANAIHKKYRMEFADEMKGKNLRRIIPFIY
jgi:3-oxo-5-alpha-steroid 4-dehydrogenase 1